MKYIKIPTDIAQQLVLMSPGEMTSTQLFERIRQELNGGYVERVVIGNYSTRTRFDGVIMLVDEDGRHKDLPHNPRASFLYGQLVHGQPIVGDAFIVGEYIGAEGADFCDLPEKWTLENLDEYLANMDDSNLP